MSLIERSTPREVNFSININPYAAGSVLAEFGNTKVHITASIEDNVPRWMKGSGKGWVTAEYSMLPSSTHTRSRRERSKIGGRTQEIQRLIGRSLRAVVDLEKLGERMITLDCDVMVADGGTRTTSISGSFIALELAIQSLLASGDLKESPIIEPLAAISCGINKEGKIIADLNYEEDSSCDTDMNIVMTESGKFIEVQGTAEGQAFSREQMDALMDCATESLKIVFAKQKETLGQ
ncbi:tRNA adenylyltransferase [Halobacteriovorax sp. BALOs_7]|uniref:Ribonuclease PH n=1 Tax=Halobacteriovorax vibrionivorans TaxID=2152716 RepID=A0ABY0IJY7_9BACT|nr:MULTISPECIES: ribonuclease PH [Halobacteriovorax]AYF45835.1 tRNA adenylyltransferase [Halobacteriovorax sp. BALOs_7]RZF22875.1 ribonuclease PH [Halobacteriovorax vibrionivorans]TGD47332.1 ribonuclease PH [Halobacteriovorax sp. Y22]